MYKWKITFRNEDIMIVSADLYTIKDGVVTLYIKNKFSNLKVASVKEDEMLYISCMGRK